MVSDVEEEGKLEEQIHAILPREVDEKITVFFFLR
jgi:hypothetical protein